MATHSVTDLPEWGKDPYRVLFVLIEGDQIWLRRKERFALQSKNEDVGAPTLEKTLSETGCWQDCFICGFICGGRGGVWWTGEHKHHLKGRYVGTLWLTDASWEWGPSVATIPYFQDKSEMRLLMYNLTLFICYFFLPFWPHCVAHRILVPQPRIEFVPPAAGSWSLNCWTTRELPILWFLKVYN